MDDGPCRPGAVRRESIETDGARLWLVHGKLAQTVDGKLAMHVSDVTSSGVIHRPPWAHFSSCRRVVDF
jgi:hypothetical protein